MSSVVLRCCSINKRKFMRIKLFTPSIRFVSTIGDHMKSMHPDIEIPKAHMVEFVMKDFGNWHDKIAIECAVTQKKYTFEELRKNSINLGKALRKVFQLKKDDVVGLLLFNNPDYPICAFATILSGLTVTMINSTYTVDEIARHLKDSDVKVLFTHNSLWDTVQKGMQTLKMKIPTVIVKIKDDEVIPNGAINYDDLLHLKTDLPDVVAVDDEQVICLPYSSGTTGLPKGVMLTNRNLVANLAQHDIPALQYAVKASNNHQEVLALVLPMYHIYGFTVSTLSLLKVGCKLITIPKFKRNSYLEVLARHKPTILHIVPPLVTFITTHPGVKSEYFQRLKVTLCGAAPLGASDEDKFRAVVAKPTKIIQAYGMTETSPMAFITPHALEGKCSGTFGHPVSNTLIKVVDPDDPTLKHLGPNQPGEILIKGPQVMKGYYKNSIETESAFVNGWYRTGDVAKYDENEMFFITDRIKELIKVKGFQVAPFELEAIIKNFPGVLESAVIGIPHEYLGESPRAYVVQKPGEKVNTEELIQFVRSKVAKHKNLAGGVIIVDRIPKNPSGKILRRQLRFLYETNHV